MKLIDAGDYDSGYALLEEIGNNDAITSNKYDRAMKLIDTGNYDAGYALLKEIGRNDAITSNKYDRAVDLMESGNYTEAISMFRSLNGYKDSIDKVTKCLILKQKAELANVKVGSTIKFGFYEQDNKTSNGKEEIEWQVLAKEGTKILVISKYALDCQRYNSTATNTTWKTCTLRTWLNKTFYNEAFGTDHQKMIVRSTVSADTNPQYSTNPGNATNDKVFLLSIREAEKYFSTNNARQCKPTNYAVAKGAYVNSAYGNCWWWLRSPGCNQYGASGVYHGGSVNCSGNRVYVGDGAVRPALWIDLTA